MLRWLHLSSEYKFCPHHEGGRPVLASQHDKNGTLVADSHGRADLNDICEHEPPNGAAAIVKFGKSMFDLDKASDKRPKHMILSAMQERECGPNAATCRRKTHHCISNNSSWRYSGPVPESNQFGCSMVTSTQAKASRRLQCLNDFATVTYMPSPQTRLARQPAEAQHSQGSWRNPLDISLFHFHFIQQTKSICQDAAARELHEQDTSYTTTLRRRQQHSNHYNKQQATSSLRRPQQ